MDPDLLPESGSCHTHMNSVDMPRRDELIYPNYGYPLT